MQKNTGIIIAIITLVLGLGIGYCVDGKKGSYHNMGNENTTSGMAQMMHGMMMGLDGKTGDAFDKEFLAEMIVHHQGAVDMAQAALTNAKHQEIKNLASMIIEAQNKEIVEMKTWQKAWYNQ